MNSFEQQLSVRWRFNAGQGALIWQLMFTGSGDLIGQKRFVASRQARLFCIDPETGEVFSDDYQLMDSVHSVPAGEGWFTGLETTSRDLVYCHVYQRESPEHLGIWALDLRRTQVVWSRQDIIFAANLDHEFLVYRLSVFAGFPERHFMLIDPLSGETIRELGVDTLAVNAIRGEHVREDVRQQVILPEFVTDHMSVERLVLQKAGISDNARCECIMQGPLMIVAQHELIESSGLWLSTLTVFQDESALYADSMEEQVEKPCVNNFLIRGAQLYYIKNKEELVCVALS
jgi:hypothetical protein